MMNSHRIHATIQMIILTIIMVTVSGIPCVAMPTTGSDTDTTEIGASKSLRGTIDNVTNRCCKTLDYYDQKDNEESRDGNRQIDKPNRFRKKPRLNSINNSYLTPKQVIEWHEFQKENPQLRLALAISKFSMQNDVSKNKLRNQIGVEKIFKNMTKEERTEYMKGDIYKAQKERIQEELERKKEQLEHQARMEKLKEYEQKKRAQILYVANTAPREIILKALHDEGDADYFLELRGKARGTKLNKKEQAAWDKFIDRMSHDPSFNRYISQMFKPKRQNKHSWSGSTDSKCKGKQNYKTITGNPKKKLTLGK